MHHPFSVVFCGTPEFAVPSLRALAADNAFHVRAVVTQPDRPVGRSGKPVPPAVKTAAHELGIHVWQPESLNKECNTDRCPLVAAHPDFLVVVAYGQILNDMVLQSPKIAPINVHASLLPRWRGAAPIQHAILAGDSETGVTIQVMVKALDAGAVLRQAKTPIAARETASTLHDRLSKMGAELLVSTLKQPLKPVEQPTEGITVCRKLEKEQGAADPSAMNAVHIDRMVRALTPWPGVTIKAEGGPLKILETSLIEVPESHPLPCASGSTLWLMRVQPASGKEMSGAAWARGKRA